MFQLRAIVTNTTKHEIILKLLHLRIIQRLLLLLILLRLILYLLPLLMLNSYRFFTIYTNILHHYIINSTPLIISCFSSNITQLRAMRVFIIPTLLQWIWFLCGWSCTIWTRTQNGLTGCNHSWWARWRRLIVLSRRATYRWW